MFSSIYWFNLLGNAISEVYEVLKSQQPDVVGIFTAKKNSQVFIL